MMFVIICPQAVNKVQSTVPWAGIFLGHRTYRSRGAFVPACWLVLALMHASCGGRMAIRERPPLLQLGRRSWRPRGSWPTILAAVLALLGAAVALGDDGAVECPCLAPNSPLLAAIQDALAAKSYPRGYGQGCSAHDVGSKVEGCWGSGPSPYYCSASWCYVDPDLCPENQAKCEAAGGQLGVVEEPSHAYCRTRPMTPSSVLNASDRVAFFSYETCGFQNKYDENFLASRIAGRHVSVALPPFEIKPWLYKDGAAAASGKLSAWQDTHGILVDLMDALLQAPSPKLNLSLSSWASESSRAQHPLSIYTACCLDVMVGNVDICIGDFWVTAERLAMGVEFLYSYATDKMFLVATHSEDPPDLVDILKTPWLPFTADLWVVIVCYILFISAAVTLTTDSDNEGDFDNNRLLSRWIKACWLSGMGFVSRSIKNNPKSTPARVAAFGYGFFLLVTLQSWTAALASILVARNAKYGIRNFKDVLDRNAKVCCLEAISAQMMAVFPRGSYHIVSDRSEMHRDMILGKCDVGLVSEPDLPLLMSGYFNQDACAREEAGQKGWEKGASGCERDANGQATTTRDCRRFRDTGDVVLQIPLSMPVQPMYGNALSVELLRYISTNKLGLSRDAHVEKVTPSSACGVGGGKQKSAANEAQLGVEDMAGTILTAMIFQVIALCLWAWEAYTSKPISVLVGLESEPQACTLSAVTVAGRESARLARRRAQEEASDEEERSDVQVSASTRTERNHNVSFRRFDSIFSSSAAVDRARRAVLSTEAEADALEIPLPRGPRPKGQSVTSRGQNVSSSALNAQELLEMFEAQQHQAVRDLCMRLQSAGASPIATAGSGVGAQEVEGVFIQS